MYKRQVYRLVCSNGMVVNDAKTQRYHVGRVTSTDDDFQIYSQETLDADDKAFVLKPVSYTHLDVYKRQYVDRVLWRVILLFTKSSIFTGFKSLFCGAY